MSKIALLTEDKVFGRMLELELKLAGHTVFFERGNSTDDAQSPHEQERAEFILLDIDTCQFSQSDDEVLRTVMFTASRELYESMIAETDDLRCFLRPFEVGRLVDAFRELSGELDDDIVEVRRHAPMLEFDTETARVYFDGTRLELTKREYELLFCLYESRGEAVSREELARRVWHDEASGNVVDVYVRYLREKLDNRFNIRMIETVRKKGYRFNSEF